MLCGICGFLARAHLPQGKIAVLLPVHNAANEQCIGIIFRPGHKVLGTVLERHIYSRHSVVWGRKQGIFPEQFTVLISQEFEEASCCSGMLFLHDVNHLQTPKTYSMLLSYRTGEQLGEVSRKLFGQPAGSSSFSRSIWNVSQGSCMTKQSLCLLVGDCEVSCCYAVPLDWNSN